MVHTAVVTAPAPTDIVTHLLVDLVAMCVLVGVAYRRHSADRGMMFALFVLNLGLFATLVAITGEAFSTSAAFGLFGMLSLIRLRSASFTTPDMAYTFLALVLGLVTALAGLPTWLTLGAAGVLVTLAVVGDRPRPQVVAAPTRTVDVVLDGVYSSPEVVLAEVRSRLGMPVLAAFVDEVDYVREVTKVRAEVQSQAVFPGAGPAPDVVEHAPLRNRRRAAGHASSGAGDDDRVPLDLQIALGLASDGYPAGGVPASPDVPFAPEHRPRDGVRRLRSSPDPFPSQSGGWERA
jgi:hypothetical protein